MRAPAFLDRALFAALAGKAAEAPRRRAHHNLHEMSEPCHRLAVGLQPDTYIPPHRHLSADKAETLLVLQGRIGLLLFGEDGTLEQTRLLEAGGDCLGVDLAPGQFHALAVLENDSILFECKAGPYRPLVEAEQAAWAPREGEVGVADYLVWMKSHFPS
ncbi:WbuC family cupin fold metalloprotein [Pseudomonas sp. Gutcm_11s]|uniref:WbuC family cupin fold metalloprotein n=1 Tax=Pseudomonas sp. Gutcm_11s TaxID=3026088 RepID=UPI002361DA97|nr:WbuC family cupin fold metalloprotein [Pseudomonas sp. Gutcm_11s]MDD0841507.1 WbuC family cupin fold metalloprotein [Pseudomonas sp. Gutcm_11s]